MRRPCPPRKKLRNYLPGFVQSLLAKHNSLSNSRRQQYNSGSAHQPTHPHKPAAMCARLHNIPHNHGKLTICCSTHPKTYGPPAVLGYLSLHGFTVPTAPASRKAQGRSASGRNGGARKTTSSNSVVMRIASNDFVVVSEQAVHSIRHFMTNRSSYSAVCVRSSFVPA